MHAVSVSSVPKFVLAFALLVLLSACSGPRFQFPKPEILDSPQIDLTRESPASREVITAVQGVADSFYKKLSPHLVTLNKFSECDGCDGMRDAVTNSMRGAQELLVIIERANRTITSTTPVTPRELQIANEGRKLVAHMGRITSLTLEALLDAHAYIRARQEWNLSQLNEKNEKSLNTTLQEIERAKQDVLSVRKQFLASL